MIVFNLVIDKNKVDIKADGSLNIHTSIYIYIYIHTYTYIYIKYIKKNILLLYV